MTLLLLLLLFILIQCNSNSFSSRSHNSNKYMKDHEQVLLKHMRDHAASNIWHDYNDTFDKGIVTCAGNHMVPRYKIVLS